MCTKILNIHIICSSILLLFGSNLQCEKGNSNQVGKLLDHLLRGDSETLDRFIYGVRATGPVGKELAQHFLGEPKKADSVKDDVDGGFAKHSVTDKGTHN